MKCNMGPIDRGFRILAAVAVAALILFGVLKGTLAVVLGVLAGVFLLTALFGFCPLYVPFRITTRKKAGPGPSTPPGQALR